MWGWIARLGLLSLLIGPPAWAAPADEPPQPIRDFNIAMIERLGNEMYAQDQEAWKATDLLLARVPQDQAHKDRLHGWIVETQGTQDLVRFIHDTDKGPESYFDVSFAGVAPPFLSEPRNRTLTPEELSQYNARLLAMSTMTARCSDTYNTIALKDPQGDGWIVWVMASTKDPDALMMGGHARFTVSKDGKTVLRRDALSRDCIQFSRKDGRPGGAMILSHVVSLTPVETHVFASLTYRVGFYLGTNDGRTWHIADGHITGVNPDMEGFDGVAARMTIGQSETCHLLGKKNGKVEELGPVKVTATIEGKSKFAVPLPPGVTTGQIMCTRDSLIPLPNDYKLLLAGFPLAIGDNGTGHPKGLGVLDVADGKLRFQMIDGKMTADQQKSVQARLEQLQRAFNADLSR